MKCDGVQFVKWHGLCKVQFNGKPELMKTKIAITVISCLLLLSGCVYVDTAPGPPGIPGRAFFGVNYEVHAPYSYWDTNGDVPYNPALGHYFLTRPGYYEFEYFINPYEYWYGSYELFVNPGGPGGPYGEPGFNGADTYLMLICDPNGFHTHGGASFKTKENGILELRGESQMGNYHIKMTKAHIQERSPKGNHPKLK